MNGSINPPVNRPANRIIWLSQKPLPPKVEALREAFAKEAFLCESLSIPADGVSPQWLLEKLKESPFALIIVEDELKRVTEWVHTLRGITALTQPPVIWLPKSGLTKESALHLKEAVLDDVFSIDENPYVLLARLQFRRRDVEQKATFETRVAKSDTTLKQREEFLSVCAHDLRSPLGLIQSSMGILLNAEGSAALSPFHRELLTRAKRQAGIAITLVNDLLDVMSYEQGLKPQYHLIKIHDLLDEFYKDYRFQAEQKEVRFHYDNPIGDWRVLADSDRVRQLLQNLFTNALKFTEKGKNIYLKVAPFYGRRKSDPPYPMMIISLKDEGRGIPQSEIDKIFDRFSQIKDASRAEGRGLGLTVAKQISNSHDGNIWVQSEEGKGSTFFVLFPHVVSHPKEEAAQTRKRALIAETASDRRETYYRQMEQWGYDLIFARNGVEVVTLLFHQMPDLVILSPGLAKMDETEVAHIARGDSKTSSIPLLLALEDGQKLQKRHEQMILDDILKLPFSKSSFDLTMNKVASQRAAPTKKVA